MIFGFRTVCFVMKLVVGMALLAILGGVGIGTAVLTSIHANQTNTVSYQTDWHIFKPMRTGTEKEN